MGNNFHWLDTYIGSNIGTGSVTTIAKVGAEHGMS